jgi:PAS domain S-box-containing protein
MASDLEEGSLNQMIALSPDRFFRQDRELRYTWISHQSLFGHRSSDLLGKTSFEIFSPDEAAKLTEVKRRVMAAGVGERAETHVPIKGVERHFDAFYEPWRNEAGEIVGIAGYVRDITERKVWDIEIGRMTRAVEMAPTAIVLTDLDGMIEYVNPGFLQMGGFLEASEVLGRSVFDFTDEEGGSRLMDEIIPVLNSIGQWRGEMPVQNKAGRAYFVEMICALIKDDLGRPSYFLANFYNITDRKLAEEALLLDESRLEALLKLNQMDEATLQEITDFALEAGVKLTSSSLGYLAFVDDEKTLVMHSWSENALEECRAHKQIVYPVETTGLWGEALRQRKAIITNDYSTSHLKKGLPEGHVEVLRHMNVPVFDKGKVVAIAGVGNKDDEYDDSDVRQLTLLMSGMWKIIQRRRAEEALKSAHDCLEKRVEERTAWLLRANEALHEEMAKHKKTEIELRRARKTADAASQAKSEFLANMSHEIELP